MAQHGKKYSGDLIGRKWGSDDGFVDLGNVTELTTSKGADTDELTSTGRDDYGEAIDIESLPGATGIKITFNTFDKHALARALMGEAVDLSTEAVDIDGEIKVGMNWLDTGYHDIDPENFALVDSTETPVDASTYELNTRLGIVRFNTTSTLEPGEVVKFAGKTKGRAGYQIDANTLTSLPLELKLDGKDRITGQDGVLIIPHAVLSADGDINWFSDDWWQSGLSGKLVKDNNKPTMRFTEYL